MPWLCSTDSAVRRRGLVPHFGCMCRLSGRNGPWLSSLSPYCNQAAFQLVAAGNSSRQRGRCGGESSRSLHVGIGQVLMDQLHRHSALAHRGGAPLDRAAAHVARGEHARHARLQEERLPRTFLPLFLTFERITVQFPSRQDEASLVELDGPLKPSGIGPRTDEDEERPRPQGAAYARAVVLYHELLQAVLSRELPDLGFR